MFHPSRDAFLQLARQHRFVPVYREIPADLETPVSAFLKVASPGGSYLLESVERGEQMGRYSFLGIAPTVALRVEQGGAQVWRPDGLAPVSLNGRDPLHLLKELLTRYQVAQVPGLPRFWGGAVGYLGYDVARHFERLPHRAPEVLHLPEALFFFTDQVVVFDHVRQRMQVVVTAAVGDDPSAAYDEACARVETVTGALRRPLPRQPGPAPAPARAAASNFTKPGFEEAVRAAKGYIEAGDAFQIVLSQRISRPTAADPVTIYRALRMLNPSPYMFYLDFGDFQLIGSSPEVLVKTEDGVAELRPIAGTRPRGADEEADRALSKDLLADPKERAEHVMLVDLGRNDLGRVCRYGSVKAGGLMEVERYSHVMHLVSTVKGDLAAGRDQFDVARACFPAGTVTGAPKIRAMEIIDELEPSRRGPYAGAVGYFSFWGAMDTCITIRTIVLKDGVAHLQAGAGIVADSDPAAEYQETLNKLQALARAIDAAEEGLDS